MKDIYTLKDYISLNIETCFYKASMKHCIGYSIILNSNDTINHILHTETGKKGSIV